ncbi:MAG: hypothetical protein PUE51_00525 [Veillonellaceae bacterium]|uniref:hypothetical protein n=1 Tax=uncultured Selenomonas sp. TaxID=159275 RepID=UPI0025F3C8B7|nr:hypothetical protein [uncultured Selenomonas sp.]MDD6696833.1 hypothetical protein [Veillonellaceae bacterium]
MKRIFCGLSCGLVMVVCCAVFLLSVGTVAAHAHAASEAACVRAGDFASHGIALGQAAGEEQLSSAFGKVLYDDVLSRWGIPLTKYTFQKDVTVYTLQKTGQVAEIVLEKDAATARDGIRYGATSYYIQHVFGKSQRENVGGDACFVYRGEDSMRLIATVDHDNGSLTALRLTLLPLTEDEADAWAEAHPEAMGDVLTTELLKGGAAIDTSALPEAPAPKLEGLTN